MNNRTALCVVVLLSVALAVVLICWEKIEFRQEPWAERFDDTISDCKEKTVTQRFHRHEHPERQVAAESAPTEFQENGAGDDLTRPDFSAVAERKVRMFNAETDRWVKERPITAVDIQVFCAGLTAVPHSRRMECLRRALNLIPNANAALLAGVVLDKTQDAEIVETTFRDIVNRPEEVKEPILKEIAKDKTHPCYSDVEWIYEVTGEKPTE